jgi:hypothetical protein
MKFRITTALAALLALGSSAFAANWVYLGEGFYRGVGYPQVAIPGQSFSYFVDVDSVEHQNALRGIWVKYDLHNNPYYHLTKFSISCANNTVVQTEFVVHDGRGVVSYNGYHSNQTYIPSNDTRDNVRTFVCADYYGRPPATATSTYTYIPRP